MSDRRIDELPVKTAAQLALTDFLIGHGDGAPAAFRSELDEVLDFLGPTLVSRFSDDIVGEVVGEIGSNEDGFWVRFGNGLQVCWLHSDEELVTSTSSGGVFYTTFIWRFPQPFIERPAVFSSADRSAGGITWGGNYGTSATSTGLYVIGATASSAGAPTAVAVGRWK